ncbi:MAG: ATP-binding cassette domain-containing protein [Treponema sp.]|nr:ATP-binding cassette domain-containing protein [Treponema sp.]
MNLLECKDLSLGYGTTLIQEKLNLSIQKGGYIFILGENGSGKSTLVKTMLGFIKPFAGTIEYSPDWKKKGLGYLPQTSEIQKTFPATVKEIVLSGFQADLGLLPFYKKQHYEKARQNLERVGMQNYIGHSFKELSGGQQQRVLFARALCAASSVLVMDEPAKGFDSDAVKNMYQIVSELNKQGLTVITISHDQEAAQKYATQIITLQKREALK